MNKLRQDFCDAIVQHTGIIIREKDWNILDKKISIRMQDLNLKSPQEYYQLLNDNDWRCHQEWEKLSVLLTNNESYFFRDENQINLLREHIIPELIQRNQFHRTIRICSVGCSTGEEPYSLAIMLKEAILDFWQWKITILGIDIDRQALNEARKGIYNPWSFRGVSELIKQKYFEKIKNQYHLSPEIKKIVKFQAVNLVKDAFPQAHTELREMDLMVCRNVFIYFEEAATANVLEKIYYTLKASGYFLAGHTELSGHDLKKFETKVFPESIIYQKKDSSISAQQKTPASEVLSSLDRIKEKFPHQINQKLDLNLIKPTIDISKKLSELVSKNQHNSQKSALIVKEQQVQVDEFDQFQEIKTLIENKQYNLAIEKLNQILQLKNNCFKANYLMAQIHANLRKYAEVNKYCQQVIAIDSFSVIPHYLLAQIAEEQGNKEEAKRIFKKIIYLEPNSISAYIDLSYLYQQEGDLERTIKMQREALNLLRQLPSHTRIPEKGNLTAAELILQLEANIL
jgi:chemotaxis protein methyltransferase CheR